MARMNWNRVRWESRYVQATREGLVHDENRLDAVAPAKDTPRRPPKQRPDTPSTPNRRLGSPKDHSVTISASASKRWTGHCHCGWIYGPGKQSVVRAESRKHEAEPKTRRRASQLVQGKQASEWLPTDIACHVCDSILFVLDSGGKAAGSRCAKCGLQWVMQEYDQRTQLWLQEALEAAQKQTRLVYSARSSRAPSPTRLAPPPGGTRKPEHGLKANPCKHRIVAGTCPLCKGKGVVYITGGGTRFHKSPNCPSLAKGQRNVADRGGEPMQIDGVVVRSSRLLWKDPCRTCFRVV